MKTTWRIGDTTLSPQIENGWLRSLGTVSIGDRPLRHPGNRWLPWFDTYRGDVFRQFKFLGVAQRGNETIINTRAVSDPDVVFQEFRDTSGDSCFRPRSWDAAPLEADLRIGFAPVKETVDGRNFTGFKYWFEFESRDVPIHRLIDRATWEVGGNLDDVQLCLRSWLTPAKVRLTRGGEYSTAGLEKVVGVMPGNMWARWSTLPAFDLQYGRAGVLVGWYDHVSLIRSVFETMAEEDWLRVIESHWFTHTTSVRTNPKTIVWSPDRLDDTEALNLWTRLQDRERDKARVQFDIRDEQPPAVVIAHNEWKDFHYARTYEHLLGVAAELGADYMFVDPPWEHMEAFRATLAASVPAEQRQGTVLEKMAYANMCCTLDWKVADIMGGENALKGLCDRAAMQGLKVISWMAIHNSPYSILRQDPRNLGHGTFGVFAARESGRHPDTGYPGDCWPLNMNAPVADYMREQILGVCQRTGLAGFLWDSFSNLGWWQVDYSKGDMRPQFDKMAQLFAALTNAGLYLTAEGQAAFSTNSMIGMHGGNTYADDLLGYSYSLCTALWWGENTYANSMDCQMIRGQYPTDMLFQCFAHKRSPILNVHMVPRTEWHAPSVIAMKDMIAAYKKSRPLMKKRTVLKDGTGVLWEGPRGEQTLFALTNHGDRQANRVYRC